MRDTVRVGDLENQESLCIYKFRIVQLVIMETFPCHLGKLRFRNDEFFFMAMDTCYFLICIAKFSLYNMHVTLDCLILWLLGDYVLFLHQKFSTSIFHILSLQSLYIFKNTFSVLNIIHHLYLPWHLIYSYSWCSKALADCFDVEGFRKLTFMLLKLQFIYLT